jgi:integrase
LDVRKDLFDEWLESIEKVNTRNGYGPYLNKLFDKMNTTAEEMRQRLKESAGEPWREAKKVTLDPAFTAKGREITLCAFRHFMRYCDVFPPNDKIPKAPKAKRTPYMKWEEALKLCDAATPPYRWIFRLQAYCGWGIGEFLRFNGKAENWTRAKNAVIDGKDYFRFEFPNRKRNEKSWYTLIPTFVLKEIFDATNQFPLTTTRGKPLDSTNYHSSVVLLESAFKNAASRAALKFDPMPSPHEFRDTFKTHCTKCGVIPECKEFSLGHKVDPLGYEKCIEDPDFVWSEIRKAYGPTTQELEGVAKENQELRESLRQMQQQVDELRKGNLGPLTKEDVRRMIEQYAAKA